MLCSHVPAMLVMATAAFKGPMGPRAAAAAFGPRMPPNGRATYESATTAASSALRLASSARLGSSFSPPAANAAPVVEQMRIDSEREMREVERLYGYYEGLCADAAPGRHDSDQLTGRLPTARPALLTTREQVREFLSGVDTVLFDCDGVLYRWPDPIPGARECLRALLRQPDPKAVYFVTNNAGTSRRQLCDKLNTVLDLGVEHSSDADGDAEGSDLRLTKDMIFSSSYSAARFLQQQLQDKKLQGRRLYVVGSLGLCQELEQAGFVIAGGGPSEPGAPTSMNREELAAYDFTLHDPIDAVVVGHDTDFNFRKLCVANVLLQRNPTAPLVATNEDPFDLVGVDARHIPGNGCVVRALEHSSNRKAVNVGKPSRTLAELIAQESGGRCVPSRSVIVGDRLDTDIKFGSETGMYSLLVMTGVTTAEYLAKLGNGTDDEPLPTHIVSHVGLLS